MRDYFIRRLLLIPPTLFGVTLLVFCVTRFAPGGPFDYERSLPPEIDEDQLLDFWDRFIGEAIERMAFSAAAAAAMIGT